MSEIIAILDGKFLSKKVDFKIKWRMTDECNYRCSYCIRNSMEEHRDEKQYYENAKRTATAIGKMLEKSDKLKKAELELIGGEPSIFDLTELAELMLKETDKIKHVHVTTNFHRPVEFYENFLNTLISHGVDVNITMSFHYQFANMKEYFEKVDYLLEKGFRDKFICEMVSIKENQEEVKAFWDECKLRPIKYNIEKDIVREHNVQNCDVFLDNNAYSKPYYYMIDFTNKKCDFTKEPTKGYKKTNARYILVWDDGRIEEVPTRNAMLCKDESIIYGRNVRTKNFFCTSEMNFVDILYDKVTVCRIYKSLDIEDFTPFTLEDCGCRSDFCSMCGNMSVAADKSFFEKITQ